MCDLTPTTQLELPLDDRAPGMARHFMHDAVCSAHHAGVVDEADLLVSELVTNGVRYGGPPILLRAACEGEQAMIVSVSDGNDHMPVPREADEDAESGRGMTLVDYISDDWGAESTDKGKRVWFVLHGH